MNSPTPIFPRFSRTITATCLAILLSSTSTPASARDNDNQPPSSEVASDVTKTSPPTADISTNEAVASESDGEKSEKEESKEKEEHSLLHKILCYLPNRILDATDLVRARVRVGPGVAVDARATKFVRVGLGSYLSLYGGLPGPRQRPMPRSPIGFEAYSGASLSVAEASFKTGFEPGYSPSEVGAGVHLGIVGLDIGVDPLEAVDLLTGLVGIDIIGDDF